MTIGRGVSHWLAGCAVMALVAAGPSVGLGQGDGDCAAGELGLYSMTLLEPELALPGHRFGATLRWDQLPDLQTTCAVIVDSAGVGVDLVLSGAYSSDRDREFLFQALAGGEVATQDFNTRWLDWSNIYTGSGGTFGGTVNLSGTGGVRGYSRAGDEWTIMNDGLPVEFSYGDILAMAISPVDAGHMLIHVSSAGDLSPSTGWRGLWEKQAGGQWMRVAEDLFSDGVPITSIVFAPNGVGYAVGTAANYFHGGGLYVTDDGTDFRFFGNDLDPDVTAAPDVQDLLWTPEGDLFAAVQFYGVFHSADGGMTFAGGELDTMNILQLGVDGAGNLIAAGNREQLLRSTDDGATWTAMTGDLSVTGDVTCVAFDPDSDNVVVIGTDDEGLWRTVDGGTSWLRVGEIEVPDDAVTGDAPEIRALRFLPVAGADDVYALVQGVGMVTSADDGATWTVIDSETNRNYTDMAISADDPDLVIAGTYGGGIFRVGESFSLTGTITPNGDYPEYDDLPIGLEISIGAGTIPVGASFRVVAQDFQGYVVWRAKGTDPNAMDVIGVYDKTNPESCYEGFCGDDFYTVAQNCFSEKRAMCFDFSTPGQVAFFDDNIYNGFAYIYAVGTFDYGNIANLEEPTGLNSEMLLSEIDAEHMLYYTVNVGAAAAEATELPYVYPNPLRRGVGLPSGLGEEVVFTNLPAGSEIIIFGLAGGEVGHLYPEDQTGSNLYWVTRHKDNNELLASGVYIWKLMRPNRDDYFEKLVIIR